MTVQKRTLTAYYMLLAMCTCGMLHVQRSREGNILSEGGLGRIPTFYSLLCNYHVFLVDC